MKKNNLGNVFNNDTIIISDLFKVIFNSKKIIVSITLFCSLLAFYSSQEEPQFESVSVIEVGTFRSSDGKERLIEPMEKIIDNLRIQLFYKQQLDQQKIKIESIEEKIIKISSTSSSLSLNENLLNGVINFVLDRHSNILLSNRALLDVKLNDINNKLNFMNNSLREENELYRLAITDRVVYIDAELIFLQKQSEIEKKNIANEIINIESKIVFLNDSLKKQIEVYGIPENSQEDQKFDPFTRYVNANFNTKEIFTLSQRKIDLKNKLENLSNNNFQSAEVFSLEQERIGLNKQLDFLNQYDPQKETMYEFKEVATDAGEKRMFLAANYSKSDKIFDLSQEKNRIQSELLLDSNNSQLINGITTSLLATKRSIITLLGAIFGFTFSIIAILTIKKIQQLLSN